MAFFGASLSQVNGVFARVVNDFAVLILRPLTPSVAAADRATAPGRRTPVPSIGTMAYLKDAEAFLAKLPSISLEGMDQLGVQSSVKLQMAPCESQGHKVSFVAPSSP